MDNCYGLFSSKLPKPPHSSEGIQKVAGAREGITLTVHHMCEAWCVVIIARVPLDYFYAQRDKHRIFLANLELIHL